uniref:Uncharacterized protein n=1 Tax=Oryza meridionalis TaxID=40149 RepID=A0A0E0EBI9_9ORYZ
MMTTAVAVPTADPAAPRWSCQHRGNRRHSTATADLKLESPPPPPLIDLYLPPPTSISADNPIHREIPRAGRPIQKPQTIIAVRVPITSLTFPLARTLIPLARLPARTRRRRLAPRVHPQRYALCSITSTPNPSIWHPRCRATPLRHGRSSRLPVHAEEAQAHEAVAAAQPLHGTDNRRRCRGGRSVFLSFFPLFFLESTASGLPVDGCASRRYPLLPSREPFHLQRQRRPRLLMAQWIPNHAEDTKAPIPANNRRYSKTGIDRLPIA